MQWYTHDPEKFETFGQDRNLPLKQEERLWQGSRRCAPNSICSSVLHGRHPAIQSQGPARNPRRPRRRRSRPRRDRGAGPPDRREIRPAGRGRQEHPPLQREIGPAHGDGSREPASRDMLGLIVVRTSPEPELRVTWCISPPNGRQPSGSRSARRSFFGRCPRVPESAAKALRIAPVRNRWRVRRIPLAT